MSMKYVMILILLVLSTQVSANSSQRSMTTLSLQNLERERAAFINDLLDPSLDIQKRIAKINKRQRHLTDIERMVMRDERLLSEPSKWVKNAFDNYESTFLVHAGAEKKQEAKEYWLTHVNLTNERVFNTRATYRKN